MRFLVWILAMWPALALAEDDSVIGASDVKTLVETILNLPKLGVVGIILFIVAAIVAFGVWWWWNGYTQKITKKQNDERRAQDQASNATDNQEVSDEWDQATEKVEDVRENLEEKEGTKQRPPRP